MIIASSMNIDQLVQKVVAGVHRQHGDLMGLSQLLRKESELKRKGRISLSLIACEDTF